MIEKQSDISDNGSTIYRPVKLFGVVLLIFTIFGVIFFAYVFENEDSDFDSLRSREFRSSHIWFVVIVSAYYFIVAIGILRRTRWGYYLFKSILYITLPSLPMGIVSYKYLKYIKKHRIKEYFDKYI